jgi:hypothetical protein
MFHVPILTSGCLCLGRSTETLYVQFHISQQVVFIMSSVTTPKLRRSPLSGVRELLFCILKTTFLFEGSLCSKPEDAQYRGDKDLLDVAETVII